jgi:hypothetical protein
LIDYQDDFMTIGCGVPMNSDKHAAMVWHSGEDQNSFVQRIEPSAILSLTPQRYFPDIDIFDGIQTEATRGVYEQTLRVAPSVSRPPAIDR